MPRIRYKDGNLRRASMEIVERANAIITEWQSQGYDLTLRQLYYQFVSRGWIANRDTEYKRLGSIINDARYYGLIDWQAITDRTRNLRGVTHWANPEEIIEAVGRSYALNKWLEQPYRVEVWVEKDALVGIIGQISNELDVDYFSCRGYTSSSEIWQASQRLRRYAINGQTPIILHLGDHDPSGIDMSRDIEERLQLFAPRANITLRRLALNMEQIEEYNPPPNPAKLTDSRCTAYMEEHGEQSWELDALEPSVISTLIREAVLEYRDEDTWESVRGQEEEERERLMAVSTHWETVERLLRDIEDGNNPYGLHMV